MKNLARLLRSDLNVVAIASHPRLLENLKEVGVATTGIPFGLEYRKVLRTLVVPLLMLRLVVQHRVKWIVLNDHAESLFILPGKLFGCTVFVVAHGVLGLHNRHFFQLLGRFLYKRLGRFADKVICVSASVASVQASIVSASKLQVVLNWLPVLPVISERLDRTGKDPLNILFVGRLVHVKGAHILLEAVRSIEGVEVVIVGEGPERNNLERLADGSAVVFAGFQADTWKYYRAADIFVNPALDEGVEGLPFVSLESMAHGLPCVFSDIAVHREITDEGFGAELFCSGDSSSLALAILALIQDRDRRGKLGARARNLIEERHGPEVARRHYSGLFDQS